MENKKALEFFKHMARNCKDVKAVKLACNDDLTSTDTAFIGRYVNKQTVLLDLGSGTGLIINKLFDKVAHITAVEPFSGFTKYIVKSEDIEIFNQTLHEFEPHRQYDLITIFGVMHYFNEDESNAIYKKYYPFLREHGKLIVKNQFGVNEDVVVEGYSEEQKRDYFAHYRYVRKEVKMLETIGYKNIEVVDIYPPECNRWDNTYFYAIVAEK
jgi:cyclopropane fatty-acyl-phospholipid synthase-like methyltransferase